MPRSLRHNLVAWLMLACVALSTALLSGPLVVCTHPDGTWCLEWGGCQPGTHDEDTTTCADCTQRHADDHPTPCEDTPVGEGQLSEKVMPRRGGLPLAPVAELVAIIPWRPERIDPDVSATRRVIPQGRPPGLLSPVRTIVLLV